jgi:hypothetical protein
MSSAMADNSSISNDAGSVDESASKQKELLARKCRSKQKRLLIFSGRAAVVIAIVWACIFWFNHHPH